MASSDFGHIERLPSGSFQVHVYGGKDPLTAWAMAEQGAVTAGDLIPVAAAPQRLPPDVAAAWDQVREIDLRLIADRMLPDADLGRAGHRAAGGG